MNHTVRLVRRTSAASYAGQFVTRYLALENLWRRPSANLYGMSLYNQQRGTAQPILQWRRLPATLQGLTEVNSGRP
jgi:hypothetical protein